MVPVTATNGSGHHDVGHRSVHPGRNHPAVDIDDLDAGIHRHYR